MSATRLPTQDTSPGGTVHLVSVALVIVQAFAVEAVRLSMSPFRGFWPEETPADSSTSILRLLRIALWMMSLLELGTAFVLALCPHLLRSAGTPVLRKPFLATYVILSAIPLYGVALSLLSGQRMDFYVFAVPALVALLWLLTQGRRWKELAKLGQPGIFEE